MTWRGENSSAALLKRLHEKGILTDEEFQELSSPANPLAEDDDTIELGRGDHPSPRTE